MFNTLMKKRAPENGLGISQAVWTSPLPLIRTALKESWEQKPDWWLELARKWNVKIGDGIFNKPLKDFCTKVQRIRITAGRDVEAKEDLVLFCVMWRQRRSVSACVGGCVHACMCVHEDGEGIS